LVFIAQQITTPALDLFGLTGDVFGLTKTAEPRLLHLLTFLWAKLALNKARFAEEVFRLA